MLYSTQIQRTSIGYANDKIFTNLCLFKNVSSFKRKVTITGTVEF